MFEPKESLPAPASSTGEVAKPPQDSGVKQPEIIVRSNESSDVWYTFNGWGLAVVVKTNMQEVEFHQRGKRYSYPEGEITGHIHFAPFGESSLKGTQVVKPSGKTAFTAESNISPILLKGALGLRTFIKDLERKKLPEPTAFFSSTNNVRMARFAAIKLGFEIPGYYEAGMTPEQRETGLKDLERDSPTSIYVTGALANIKKSVAEMESSGLLDELIKRTKRRYGEDISKPPVGMSVHPLAP
jgi:hypothetical protein